MAKRRNKFVSQAALDAIVRYSPETAGLQALVKQAYENRDTTIRQARGTSQGIIGAVDQARPQMAQIYDRAGLAEARTATTLIGHDLAALPGAADSIKAGAALEQKQALDHLQEARTAGLTDLSQRRVAAREGQQFATQTAQRSFVHDIAQVLDRRQSLNREIGAFKASEVGKLRDAQAARDLQVTLQNKRTAQQERSSIRSAGIDPDTGKPIPGGKLDPKAKKPGRGSRTTADGKPALSLDKHLEWSTSIDEIRGRAEKYKGHVNPATGQPYTRQEIVAKLTAGRPQQTYYVDAEGNPLPDSQKANGQKVTLPSVPQYKPDLRMSAALDVALFGHLTRDTQRKLQRRGFILNELNLPTYGQWARKARQQGGRGTIPFG